MLSLPGCGAGTAESGVQAQSGTHPPHTAWLITRSDMQLRLGDVNRHITGTAAGEQLQRCTGAGSGAAGGAVHRGAAAVTGVTRAGSTVIQLPMCSAVRVWSSLDWLAC